MRSSGRKSASGKNSLWTAASRRCTQRIVVLMLSCPAAYCNVKGVRVLSGLGQKSMTQSVQAGIGMSLDLFPYLTFLFFQHPRPERPGPILRAGEDIVALAVFQKPFEYFLHFVINHQLAFSRSPFQTALAE